MKKLLLIIVLAAGIFSCQEKEEEQPQYAVVQGQFSNTEGGLLELRNLTGYHKTVNVKNDGTFTDTLEVDEGIYMVFFNSSVLPVYLTRGSVTNIKADAEDLANSVNFTGENKELNNYYLSKSKASKDVGTNMKALYSKEESEFLQSIDSIEADLKMKLEGTASFPQELKQKELRDIDYYIQDLLRNYESYHPYFLKKEDFTVSGQFKARQKDLDMNRFEDYRYSPTYNNMVFVTVMRNAMERAKQDSIPGSLAELLIASEIANDTMRELLMSQYVKMRLPSMKDGKKEYYEKYLSLSKFPEQEQEVKELYASLRKLEPGNVSPKFVNYENYAGGTTSLDDYKGKYVYIDVWATWCGPCIAELPYLEKIEEEYKEKNIEFVSISVDNEKDHPKWKKMIAEKEMGGEQLFADAAFNSQFIKDYNINGIPRFILLDQEGKIVQANAPRPSGGELEKLFEELGI